MIIFAGMLTFVIILGFACLVGAAINQAKRTGSTTAKAVAGVLIVLLLFILLF